MKSILDRFLTEHCFIMVSRLSSILFMPSSRRAMEVVQEMRKLPAPADPNADPGITPTFAVLRRAYVKSMQDLAMLVTEGNK